MSKQKQSKPLPDLRGSLKSSRPEAIGYRQIFDRIGEKMPISEGLVITTLPRGSLQIAQPGKLPEPLLKAYAKGLHAEDKLTWATILQDKAVAAEDVEGFGEGRYARDLMNPHGFAHAAAAPLRSPVLEGYPGAVHVYRSKEHGAFSQGELDQLADVASQIDELATKTRRSRGSECRSSLSLTKRPAARQFVVDQDLNEISTKSSFKTLDAHLREQLMDHAKTRLREGNVEAEVHTDRLQVPDSRGDLWTFGVITYKSYPALGSGSYVIFSLQPDCCEWGAVRATDFQADIELARLIPALKFMQAEFHRSPTLGEIASTVHLSPFHFHRRFAQLLGITPKHFLLECQIHEAKTQLLARKMSLAQIASDCGFAHQSHFTSRFKQATGLTPTRWRRLATDAQKPDAEKPLAAAV
ncbi:MAG TPA: AraC family transcriptional regulator [Tepidisphaeraceae bacterium]|nr:AraC family transcriptional regulator [Tepidisphaeraceae bacterium]